jgi:hypothetical protein
MRSRAGIPAQLQEGQAGAKRNSIPTLKNGENVDRAFRFSVRRETTQSGAKFVQFGRAVRPCAPARASLFMLINTVNVALRASLPVHRNFAALFTLYNCLSIKRKNPRKITVWEKTANQ